MATQRLSIQQAERRILTARGVAFDARTMPASQALPLVIQELGGASPARLTLRGGFGVEQGAEWVSELKGETRTPMGSAEGYSAITGRSFGRTEMTLNLDGGHLKRADFEVENLVGPFEVADVLLIFQQLQDRGRECLVSLGSFVRRGVLRQVKARPKGGHSVDLFGNRTAPGLNLDVVLTWEWAGRGALPSTETPPASPSDIAGELGAADAGFGLAMAEAADAFAPDALTAISGAIGRVRGSLSKLRATVLQVGSLVTAPARLVNEAMAAARSLGNTVNDLENLVGDTRDAYLALGPAAEGVAQALGPRPSALVRAQRAKKAIREANQQAMAAVVALFDAIARRKGRRVAVAPGQSLAEVARRELDSADRWPEIASLNQIDGQVVPPGVTEVEIPR